ncbi:hypothetical protein ACM0CO_19545 [Mycobacteroides abscessus subsp. abscessus]|uniref:hypothetical protein n=1 Tax=Mycobacteroides abscessus TaxID=36809 RepID=UPI0039EEEA48
MTSGIGNLRNRRKPRPKVQPRHPAGGDPADTVPGAPGGGAAEALRDLNTAGPSLPADPPVPAPEDVPAAGSEPSLEASESPAASENVSNEEPDHPEDTGSSPEPEESAAPEPEPANDSDNAEGEQDTEEDDPEPEDEGEDDGSEQVAPRELPDLELDWTDPLNHIERNTRLSVPNSVVLRFKAVADLPGSAQYTEIMLQAVFDKLAELPELIVGRRPKEQQVAGSFPFRRRSTPTPAVNTDPKTALYMRPNNGEVELLGRIVKWANMHIKDGHPGRKDTDRSELITAALDATLPQLPAESSSSRRPVKPAAAS